MVVPALRLQYDRRPQASQVVEFPLSGLEMLGEFFHACGKFGAFVVAQSVAEYRGGFDMAFLPFPVSSREHPCPHLDPPADDRAMAAEWPVRCPPTRGGGVLTGSVETFT